MSIYPNPSGESVKEGSLFAQLKVFTLLGETTLVCPFTAKGKSSLQFKIISREADFFNYSLFSVYHTGYF